MGPRRGHRGGTLKGDMIRSRIASTSMPWMTATLAVLLLALLTAIPAFAASKGGVAGRTKEGKGKATTGAKAGEQDASNGSDVHMQIEVGQGLQRIPLHIEDFAYQGVSPIRFPGGESPEDVLVADLRNADFFVVSRGGAPVGDPPIALPPPQGTRAIASGRVYIDGGRIVMEGSLRDATTATRIFTKPYPFSNPPDRRSVHAFSDDIVLYLTGEKGIAGTQIVYVRDHGASREIEIVDCDGENVRQLTHLGTILISPAWSPNGEDLAFTSFASGEAGVYGFRLADGKTWRISPAGMSSAPRWSPDGRSIAYARSVGGNTDIYIADANGGNPTRLTFDPAIDTAPSFNPDGTRIAFTSDRSGTPEVYVTDRDGSTAQRLTFVGKECDSPDWSPKGDLIAFVCMFDSVYDICTMPPDGTSEPSRLTAGEGSHENPHWAPDGRHLVFSEVVGGVRKIYVMAADGTGKRALTDGKGDQYNPAWSPMQVVQSGLGAP